MKKITSIFLSVILLLSMVTGMSFTAEAADTSSSTVDVGVTVTYDQTGARSMLSLVNSMRTGSDAWYYNQDGSVTTCSGLSKLTYDYSLEKVAMQRAAEIAVYFSHTRPNGETCFTAYSDYGYTYLAAGENLAYGQTSVAQAFAAWAEENDDYSGQGHRRNMLSSSYNAIAISHVYVNGTSYWVMELARSSSINTTATTANNSQTTVYVNMSSSTVDVGVTVTYDQTGARSMLSLVNSMRTGSDAWYYNQDGSVTTCSGLSKLTYDYSLEKVAMQRAAEIAVYFSHTRPNGETCFTAYSDYGYTYLAAGENLAYGQTSVAQAFAAWAEENDDYSGQGHRRNMLSSSYNAIAISHVYVNGTSYWVMELARSSSINTTATTANNSQTTVYVNMSSSSITNNIKLSKTSIAYTGTVQRPSVTVSDSNGNSLTYKKDFTVDYSNWSSKNVGTYTVTVKFIGNYSSIGSKTYTYKITAQTNVTPVLSRTTITMNGTVQRPTVTVTDKYGNKLTYNKDFTVSYSNWSSKAVGRYTVTVTMKGNYSGTKTYAYYINPKSTTITSVTGASKSFTVKWNKQTNSTTGYQIQYATKSDFSNAATIYAGASSATSKTVTGRSAKTKYYVRIRTYKNINGKYFYSDWSSAKTVTTK